jgi:hypothetical protein
MRWKRFFFDLREFAAIHQCDANSEPNAQHGSFTFANSNADQRSDGNRQS